MKEPYGEGLASHTDPESCVVFWGGLPGGLLFQNLVKLG
jgi:hypothetical protein